MNLRWTAAALLIGIAFQPVSADAAWWNPFKRDTPPTDGNAQNTPVPPIQINNGAAAAAPPATVSGLAPIGAPPVGVAAATAAPAADPVSVRLDRAEAQMRALTGQIEQLTFELKQTEDQLRQLRQDGGSQPADSAQAAKGKRSDAGPATGEVVALARPAGVNLKETPMDGADIVGDDAIGAKIDATRRGDPPRIIGTVPASTGTAAGAATAASGSATARPAAGGAAGGGPLSISSLAVTGNAQGVVAAATTAGTVAGSGAPPAGGAVVASIAPAAGTDGARAAYDRAYQNILTGDYEVAEKGLRSFLVAYPGDKLASDAQYWLGESYYARTMYKEAAAAFLDGYKTYPKGSKAAETLLKLGLSLKGLGQRDEACNTFAEVVKRYPKSSNAMLQRVKAEQTGASCS